MISSSSSSVLKRPSCPRRLRFTFNEASDDLTQSSHLWSNTSFSFFSAAGQTSLRGIFKEERGKTLFRHQSIKVWASEKTTAAGGRCVDYLCPSHHLFMVTMVRQSVAAGGPSLAQGPVMTLDWQESFQRWRTAKLPGNKGLVNISKRNDKNVMNKTKKARKRETLHVGGGGGAGSNSNMWCLRVVHK